MGFANYTAIKPWVGGMQAISATSAAAVGITISSASAASSQNTLQPNFAVITAEAVSCRWRDDGTDPTTALGMVLPANQRFEYDGDLRKIKFIALTGTVLVNVSLYNAS